MVNLTIDGKAVTVPAGTTILEAAQSIGIEIPHFCYDKDLTVFGGCRICVVEVEGARNLQASCSTPVTSGMVVWTESERVVKTRRMILELLLGNHPVDCIVCDKTGDCLLQDYCYRYGVKESPFIGEKKQLELDRDNHLIERDQNKCILCGKCVQVCHDVQVTGTIDFVERGFYTRVTTPYDLPLNTEICRFCGQCVGVCPTGALVNKQFKGTRPWEVSKVRTTCLFCGVGCNFDLNVKDGRVIGVTPTPEAPVNGRSLCVKGRFHKDLLYNPERITTPLIKRDGQFVEASWDEALDEIASRLKKIVAADGANAVAALSSARCTNEENYLMQKFMRTAVGTNNIDHCART